MDAELHLQALGAECEVLQFIVVGPMPRKPIVVHLTTLSMKFSGFKLSS